MFVEDDLEEIALILDRPNPARYLARPLVPLLSGRIQGRQSSATDGRIDVGHRRPPCA